MSGIPQYDDATGCSKSAVSCGAAETGESGSPLLPTSITKWETTCAPGIPAYASDGGIGKAVYVRVYAATASSGCLPYSLRFSNGAPRADRSVDGDTARPTGAAWGDAVGPGSVGARELGAVAVPELTVRIP
jgi:hypothetical protein